ncbi:glycosyltransferase family 2 protein [Roseateles sp. SL47]|uniref:glycosyltransferase family 2 protein n=1 Tax=Roseateles sp. SL47 TaxID=2995138 RepID=UPI002270C3C0|nr:glycosyltransferase family 2 protein [Roseateles sp. SL47]WAC71012.1 glycosyltransferase family 2 protein [Roseateles sp. SL47]
MFTAAPLSRSLVSPAALRVSSEARPSGPLQRDALGAYSSSAVGGGDVGANPAAPQPRTGQPWLSILIPVYNVSRYLRECLVSAASQCDEGIEILMLDDCSTDGSGDLMRTLEQEFASPSVRIVNIFHTENQGISVVRNALLDAARGDYIWFLDSDDCLVPGSVQQLREVIQRQAPSLVLCDFSVWRERPRLKHRLRGERHRRTFAGPARRMFSDPALVIRGLFQAGHLHCWSKIAKRSVWAGLRFPAGRYFEDVSLAAPLALRADTIWYEPQVWVAYRQREGSILATPSLVKAEHLAESLLTLPALVAGQQLDEAARFAWSHFTACNFIGTARTARAALPDDQYGSKVACFKASFERSCPMRLPELYAAYVRRGWLIRALRLRYWLQQASTA